MASAHRSCNPLAIGVPGRSDGAWRNLHTAIHRKRDGDRRHHGLKRHHFLVSRREFTRARAEASPCVSQNKRKYHLLSQSFLRSACHDDPVEVSVYADQNLA